MNKPVGGRGKKAPYESTHHRIPEPLKPAIEILTNQYREYVFEGNRLDFDNRTLLPKLPAVYFVLEDEEIIYIGQTKSLIDRWRSHHIINQLTGLSGKISIAWLHFEDSSLLSTIELTLIAVLKPRLNQKGSNLQDRDGKFLAKYENDFKTLRTMRITPYAWDTLKELADRDGISRTDVIERLARNSKTNKQIILEALDKFIEYNRERWGNNPMQKGEFSTNSRAWDKFREFKKFIENIP